MQAQALNKANGVVHLSYKVNHKNQQYCHVYQQEPLRVLFPHMSEIGIPAAILINTSGGILGGDQHRIQIDLAESTRTFITTQAAERIYYSHDLVTEITTNLHLTKNSWCEWLPQETILFNQSALKRNLNIHLQSSSTGMFGEILVFGRVSRGERLLNAFLQDRWSIQLEGDLIWQDVLYLKTDSTLNALNHPAGFDQATTYATTVYAGHHAHQYLDEARLLLDTYQTKAYVTAIHQNLLLMRWLSSDSYTLRKDLSHFWCTWRNKVSSLPNALPRIWHF